MKALKSLFLTSLLLIFAVVLWGGLVFFMGILPMLFNAKVLSSVVVFIVVWATIHSFID